MVRGYSQCNLNVFSFFHELHHSSHPVRQPVSLPICLSVSQSVCPPVCLPPDNHWVNPSACLSFCLTVLPAWKSSSQAPCQSTHLSVCQLVCLSICWSVCLSTFLFVYLSVCPPVCLSVSCQSLSQSIGLSVFLSDSPLPAESHPVRQPDGLSICLSVSPSIFLSVHLFFCLYLSSVSLALIHSIKSCLWNIEIYVLFVRSQI